MLSAETENRLAKMLLILADGEASVDVSRQVLNNQIGFDPYNLFRVVDSEAKGWVDSTNIVDFLRRYSIYCSSFDAQQIIFNYDSDSSGTINYTEFINMVVSEKNSLLRNTSLSYKSIIPVPYDVELYLARLFEKEIDYIKCLNEAIRELNLRYDFNALDAFRAIDVYNMDNLNSEGIRKFLLRNYITPSEQDTANIVKRLDINRDFRVDYTEFKNLINSQSCGLSSSCGNFNYYHKCYSPTPLRNTYYYSPLRTRLYCSPRRCYSPLRTFYSPPKKVVPYTTLKPDYLGSSNLNKSYIDLSKSTNSPLRSTNKDSFGTTTSPKRLNSPPRTKTDFGGYVNTNQSLSSSRIFPKQDINLRYPTYEEEVFLNFLRDLIQVENSLEVIKSEVALKSDFNMEDIFSIFEKYSKGYISEFDLKDGLNGYFGVFPILEEISALYKRYDTEKNGSLR